MTISNSTNVSLEPHLLDALRPLNSLLSDDLAKQLSPYINEDDTPSSIPYDVLMDIVKWARTDEGLAALKSANLLPGDYVKESLLAGTMSSPEGKFGTYVPPQDPEDLERQRARERKAIVALANGVWSVAGVGFAAWWAGDKTGWKNEWRALFALFAAIIVAVAEAILYVLWQSRSAANATSRPRRRRLRSASHKKVDPELEEEEGSVSPTGEEKETATTRIDTTASGLEETPKLEEGTTELRQRRV